MCVQALTGVSDKMQQGNIADRDRISFRSVYLRMQQKDRALESCNRDCVCGMLSGASGFSQFGIYSADPTEDLAELWFMFLGPCLPLSSCEGSKSEICFPWANGWFNPCALIARIDDRSASYVSRHTCQVIGGVLSFRKVHWVVGTFRLTANMTRAAWKALTCAVSSLAPSVNVKCHMPGVFCPHGCLSWYSMWMIQSVHLRNAVSVRRCVGISVSCWNRATKLQGSFRQISF